MVNTFSAECVSRRALFMSNINVTDTEIGLRRKKVNRPAFSFIFILLYLHLVLHVISHDILHLVLLIFYLN